VRALHPDSSGCELWVRPWRGASAAGKDIIPIPGTEHEKYLVENLGALALELTSDEISELDKLYRLVKGIRYDDNSMANTLR